ncbi:MAG: hypothetical protein OEY14_07405, partial [Myxococcales bacterium]|nr:hypothetical protein [Myxococcales bacterium]
MDRLVKPLIFLAGLAALIGLGGCGDGLDRWEGPGCQPACSTLEAEGSAAENRSLSCTDEDGDPSVCAATGEG